MALYNKHYINFRAKHLIFIVINNINNLNAPVILLHGINDNVIQSSKSITLHQKLKELEISGRLVLTPLISHGTGKIGFKTLFSIPALIKAFAFFYKNIK